MESVILHEHTRRIIECRTFYAEWENIRGLSRLYPYFIIADNRLTPVSFQKVNSF